MSLGMPEMGPRPESAWEPPRRTRPPPGPRARPVRVLDLRTRFPPPSPPAPTALPSNILERSSTDILARETFFGAVLTSMVE